MSSPIRGWTDTTAPGRFYYGEGESGYPVNIIAIRMESGKIGHPSAPMKIKTLAGCLFLSLFAVQCRASPEAEVRALVARWGQAFKIKNVEQVMDCYAPGSAVRAFDIVSPLECRGHDAYRKNYEQFFAMYRGPIELELRDLQVIAGSDVAFVTVLERMAGTLTDGQKSEMWIRVTSGLRKVRGHWLIVHDHVSVPVDFALGKALLELKP